uniref:Uncharacterized protein n=1 Tax=Cacopsylla melanoneura TaxID=428564 RepID=A0A8D8R2G6_9HEMI
MMSFIKLFRFFILTQLKSRRLLLKNPPQLFILFLATLILLLLFSFVLSSTKEIVQLHFFIRNKYFLLHSVLVFLLNHTFLPPPFSSSCFHSFSSSSIIPSFSFSLIPSFSFSSIPSFSSLSIPSFSSIRSFSSSSIPSFSSSFIPPFSFSPIPSLAPQLLPSLPSPFPSFSLSVTYYTIVLICLCSTLLEFLLSTRFVDYIRNI